MDNGGNRETTVGAAYSLLICPFGSSQKRYSVILFGVKMA